MRQQRLVVRQQLSAQAQPKQQQQDPQTDIAHALRFEFLPCSHLYYLIYVALSVQLYASRTLGSTQT